MREFTNYCFSEGKIKIQLEKDIYSRRMIDCALEKLDCTGEVEEESDRYIVRIRSSPSDWENLALAYNDALISSVRLRV